MRTTASAPAGSTPQASSWSLSPAEGAYGPVAAWTSGAAWFDALMDALTTARGEECRRSVKVARDTLLRVARAEWLSADVDTGRGVTTAHETLAVQLGMCKRTVQRCRELLELLGFAVSIEIGRYLTNTERQAARKAHGGRQHRAASVRALTLPKPPAVENVHLPSPREGKSLTPVLKSSPRRARAPRSVAPLPQQGKKEGRAASQVRGPRPFAEQKLAGTLAGRLPWLAGGRHVGAVSDLLARAGISAEHWSAQGLLEALYRHCVATGIRTVDPESHRDPIAYFAWLIRSAQQTGIEPNRIRQQKAAARRTDERAARAAEAQLEAQRVAAIDFAEVDAVLAQMRRDFPPTVSPARRLFSSLKVK